MALDNAGESIDLTRKAVWGDTERLWMDVIMQGFQTSSARMTKGSMDTCSKEKPGHQSAMRRYSSKSLLFWRWLSFFIALSRFSVLASTLSSCSSNESSPSSKVCTVIEGATKRSRKKIDILSGFLPFSFNIAIKLTRASCFLSYAALSFLNKSRVVSFSMN